MTGRIVYDRPKHYFEPSDIVRIYKAMLEDLKSPAKIYKLFYSILLQMLLLNAKHLFKLDISPIEYVSEMIKLMAEILTDLKSRIIKE